MARKRIRYLTERPGPQGPRYFWQPSTRLRGAGWRLTRLPDDLAGAIAMAETLNARVDAWRRGGPGPDGMRAAAPARHGTAAAAGSVDALILAYQASRFWSGLRAKTRREYQWALAEISRWSGDAPVGAITAALVQRFYAYLAERPRLDAAGGPIRGADGRIEVIRTPAKAAAVIRVLRLLLRKGPALGFPRNDAADRPGVRVEKQREPRLWERADVAHMARVADALGWRSVATAILLNEWAGQRMEDVLAMPRWDMAAGHLVLRQSKRGRRVALPLHLVPQVVARLTAEAERAGALVSPSHLLVHDRTGRPWDADTFRHVFAEIRAAAAAGLPAAADRPAIEPRPQVAGLWFMELRHTAITRLNEAGVDPLDIAAITGHTEKSVRAVLERHYLVQTGRAAERAFRARLAAEGAP